MGCPKCNNKEKQVWNGKNRGGSQRWLCNECGRRYTPKPSMKGYPEETRTEAKKLLLAGLSGRRVGQLLGFSKANAYNWCKAEKKIREDIHKY